MTATVIAVVCSAGHTMAKPTQSDILLLAGLGVAGDAHMGDTVNHRSRVAIDPSAPNLRQVHLIASELHAELARVGLPIPGLTAGVGAISVRRGCGRFPGWGRYCRLGACILRADDGHIGYD